MMNRREFISLTGLASATLATPAVLRKAADTSNSPGSFDFVFFTDTHIQPELAAAEGCAMAFRKIRSQNPVFAIQGGDHVFDATDATRTRSETLFDLYTRTEQTLGMEIHHTIGNHDVFGLSTANEKSDPEYGKRMYEDRMGRTYYSFDRQGYHFIILDSIQITNERSYEARIDAVQLDWLAKDLGALPRSTPVIVVTHVPLVTGAISYGPPSPDKVGKIFVLNAYEVMPLFQQHNVLGVFQGHTHINEVVTFRGIPYITCGAVCGNWWHGPRWGTPEGFTIVSLRNGVCTWRYETYGFKSIDPIKS
jgi:3',5'-cyclic-AMP phosphodiesterase